TPSITPKRWLAAEPAARTCTPTVIASDARVRLSALRDSAISATTAVMRLRSTSVISITMPSDSLAVVVAESVVDLFPLAAHTYDAKPGGSPTNVAVGLARLGQEIELLGRLGQGAFGDIVREHVHANGVGTRFAVAANEPATLAVVTLDDAGQAAYTFYAEGTSDWSWTAEELAPGFASEPLAVVAGSITLGREPGASVVGAALHQLHESGTASIVLDPNLRPQLIGSRQ